MAGWRPEPSEVMVPVERGAGQFRALGRVLTLANLKLAKRKLSRLGCRQSIVAKCLSESTKILFAPGKVIPHLWC